jgi:hypothetical protein
MFQAILCRRRHQPRRPPLAKMRPGRPAPAMGPGTSEPELRLHSWPKALLTVPPFSGPPVYPTRPPVIFNARMLGTGGPINCMSVVPLGSAMLVKNVVKGPVLGDSPAIVMFGELIAPVLLLSTKLPPSVHTCEQVAPSNRDL